MEIFDFEINFFFWKSPMTGNLLSDYAKAGYLQND